MKKIFDKIYEIWAYYIIVLLMVFSLTTLFIDPLIGVSLLVLSVVFYVIDPPRSRKKKLKIKIKYFDQEIEKIQKISVGDWIDLRSAERVELKSGEYKLLRLGVGMILPDGYEALVLPRSSTPSKFGIILANSMGVIDNSYSGDADEWRFPALAIRDTHIEKGDRICQFRIIKNMDPVDIVEVDRLNEISRGGIGSTGTR